MRLELKVLIPSKQGMVLEYSSTTNELLALVLIPSKQGMVLEI